MVDWKSPLIWQDADLAREIKALPAGRFNLYNDLARVVWFSKIRGGLAVYYAPFAGGKFDGSQSQLQEIAVGEREIRNIGPVKRKMLRAFLRERQVAWWKLVYTTVRDYLLSYLSRMV